MLTFFLGPSGVGKSTVMKKLINNHGWRKIPVYTTRPARANDDKVSITPDDFLRRADLGHFFRYSKMFGEFYGNDKASILDAMSYSSSQHWCLDMKDSELKYYPYPNILKIIILPETFEQLSIQVRADNRSDFSRDLREELRSYQEMCVTDAKSDQHIVINTHGDVEETVAQSLNAAKFFFENKDERSKC
ncbi:hypothetical protein [Donghicola tyrosinivorans]|uniref:Guanylate kinase n=1 Tax=Donghicola tyrosinivorans TaxID=1652492 RepID=A0A2T0WYG3_9RHOB|nr:hypothetical protein [Donghicola tyrosinivorans]PRY91729.1 guanylate kinase [Donghicola tyrosinivorans]